MRFAASRTAESVTRDTSLPVVTRRYPSLPVVLLQMLREERDRQRPRLLGGLEVSAVAPGLIAEEAMARAFEGVRLIELAEFLHRGFGRGNGGSNPGVAPAVHPDHRRLDLRVVLFGR